MTADRRAPAIVLLVAITLGLTASAFVLAHLVWPSDGTYLRFDTPAPAAGLVATVWRPQPAGLQSGDIILAIDGRSLDDWLTGHAPQSAALSAPSALYQIVRAGSSGRVTVQLGRYELLPVLGDRWPLEAAQIYLWLVGAVLFALRPRIPGARALFLVSTALLSSSTVYFLGLQASDLRVGLLVILWLWSSVVLYGVSMGGLLHFALVFPGGRPQLARHPWWIYLIYAGPWLPYLARVAAGWASAGGAAGRLSLLLRATDFITLVYIPLVLLGSLSSFRLARGQVERRQLRWFVWSLYIAVAPWVALNVLPGLLGWPVLLTSPVAGLLWCAIPTAIAIAILRERLFDIDVIIRRTLVYSLLSVTLALVYFGSVVLLQTLLAVVAGQQSQTLVTVLSTLAIAALFGPIRQRIQGFIDQRFYRRKVDAARTLSAFGAALRDDPGADLEQLRQRVLAVVDESLHPEHASLWLRDAASARLHAGPNK